jgi:hypothetical protein
LTQPDDANPVRPTVPGSAAPSQHDDRGVIGADGNERLTAMTGAVLLVLIVAELVTTASLRTLLSVHVIVGVLLAGPLVAKLGSTGYRFLRYYTRSPAYVRRGPPYLALRVLAPLLVVTTLVLLGSGIGLVVVGPGQESLMLRLHALSTLIWLPLLAIHAVAYSPRVPRLVADDWSTLPAVPSPGRGIRLGVNLGALLGGGIAAMLLLPAAAPWNAWIGLDGNNGPAAPLIAGLMLAVLALLATRPLRWR